MIICNGIIMFTDIPSCFRCSFFKKAFRHAELTLTLLGTCCCAWEYSVQHSSSSHCKPLKSSKWHVISTAGVRFVWYKVIFRSWSIPTSYHLCLCSKKVYVVVSLVLQGSKKLCYSFKLSLMLESLIFLKQVFLNVWKMLATFKLWWLLQKLPSVLEYFIFIYIVNNELLFKA